MSFYWMSFYLMKNADRSLEKDFVRINQSITYSNYPNLSLFLERNMISMVDAQLAGGASPAFFEN